MLQKLSQAADELQSAQKPKSSLLNDLRAVTSWLARHAAVIALLVAVSGGVLYGSAYFGYKVGEGRAEAYRLIGELDLQTTAALAREATTDLRFASARFADVLKKANSHDELQDKNAKLEALNRDLLQKNADLTLDADVARKERDKLQAVVDRTRRAEQAKK